MGFISSRKSQIYLQALELTLRFCSCFHDKVHTIAIGMEKLYTQKSFAIKILAKFETYYSLLNFHENLPMCTHWN